MASDGTGSAFFRDDLRQVWRASSWTVRPLQIRRHTSWEAVQSPPKISPVRINKDTNKGEDITAWSFLNVKGQAAILEMQIVLVDVVMDCCL